MSNATTTNGGQTMTTQNKPFTKPFTVSKSDVSQFSLLDCYECDRPATDNDVGTVWVEELRELLGDPEVWTQPDVGYVAICPECANKGTNNTTEDGR